MTNREHWDDVYRRKSPDTVTWYRAHLQQSLALIDQCGLERTAHIVDVGGGASTLVDDLLARGFERVSVADLSGQALEHSRARLGDSGQSVRWIVGDVTSDLFDENSVDLWHDRAVFHFLTEPAEREAYIAALVRCLRPGGFAIIATFAPHGPERCSGLAVTRYAPEDIAAALGAAFELVATAHEDHITPGGGTQAFAYALCRRR